MMTSVGLCSIGELCQGDGEIISKSQPGEISSKQLKMADFFFANIMFTCDVYYGLKHT